MDYICNYIVVALRTLVSCGLIVFFPSQLFLRETQYLRRSLRTRFRNEFFHELNEIVCVCFRDGIIEGYTDAC
jgi:hypothetical protein